MVSRCFYYEYGDTIYDGKGTDLGVDGTLNISKVIYSSDFETNFSSVFWGHNGISQIVETAGANTSSFDMMLIHISTKDESIPGTIFIPHDLISGANLAILKTALESSGSSVEAFIQNILIKSGDTWTYSGIVNGVNGVIIETDGEAVTLATSTEPSLVFSDYGPYSGIVLTGTSGDNTLSDNTLDNANGISFFEEASGNTVEHGSINEYAYSVISNTTGTNTLDTVEFNRDTINKTAGTLILIPSSPIQITDLVATPGDGQVTLSWTIPDDGGAEIVDYLIKYRITGSEDGATTFEHDPFTTNSITITGLTNDTSYDFGVRSISADDIESGVIRATTTPVAFVIIPESVHHHSSGSYLPGYGTNKAKPIVTPTTREPIKGVLVNLSFGMKGPNVKILQDFLVKQAKGPAAQALAKHGTTDYFGKLTKAALAEWQKVNNIKPSVGFFGPLTRAFIEEKI